jgi:hypothetical protein
MRADCDRCGCTEPIVMELPPEKPGGLPTELCQVCADLFSSPLDEELLRVLGYLANHLKAHIDRRINGAVVQLLPGG